MGETLSSPELREQMNMLAKEYDYLAVKAEHMAVAGADAAVFRRCAKRVAPTALRPPVQHVCARGSTTWSSPPARQRRAWTSDDGNVAIGAA